MSITLEGCGRSVVCESGGYCAEWDDGSCELACVPGELRFEPDLPVPIGEGQGAERKLARLTVRHVRRGALRQILGGAVSEVQRDQEFLDLTLTNVSVTQVLAQLEQ